jgi:hypothetical protein
MKFTTHVEDENGARIEIHLTLDDAFDGLIAELDEIPHRIASDNPALFARPRGEIHNACKRAGQRFCVREILKQKEVLNG